MWLRETLSINNTAVAAAAVQSVGEVGTAKVLCHICPWRISESKERLTNCSVKQIYKDCYIEITASHTIVSAESIATESHRIRLVPANVTHTPVHASEADLECSLLLIESSTEAVVEVGL